MQIIGFNLEKISAQKSKNLKGKVEIKTDLNILDISKDQVDIVKEQDVLKFSFNFKIKYAPDFAEIDFKGFILSILEKNKTKEILKHWKKKKVSDDIRLPLFNLILSKCNLRSLQLEEELGLPTHIPMPKLQPQKNTNYTG